MTIPGLKAARFGVAPNRSRERARPGEFELVRSQVFDGAVSVSFVDGFTDYHDRYLLEIDGVRPSSNTLWGLYFSNDYGQTWIGTGYSATYTNLNSSSAPSGTGIASYVPLASLTQSGPAYPVLGEIDLMIFPYSATAVGIAARSFLSHSSGVESIASGNVSTGKTRCNGVKVAPGAAFSGVVNFYRKNRA